LHTTGLFLITIIQTIEQGPKGKSQPSSHNTFTWFARIDTAKKCARQALDRRKYWVFASRNTSELSQSRCNGL